MVSVEPGYRRAPSSRSVVERDRCDRGAHPHDGHPPGVAGPVRRTGDQARPADVDDRGGARPAVPPPSLSGRGGRVVDWRDLLHLRDARRRPRAGALRVSRRAAWRARGVARDVEAVGAGVAPRAPQENPAAPVGIRKHARAVPEIHGADVRYDHACGRGGQPHRGVSCSTTRGRRAWFNSTRSIRPFRGSTRSSIG